MDIYQTQVELLKAISHPTRLAILTILREGEQCVCHMEATLGLRQAYISQQLIVLKEAGLVEPRRDGLNLYYHIIKPEIFAVLDALVLLTGMPLRPPVHKHANINCPCPKCSGKPDELLPQITAVQKL